MDLPNLTGLYLAPREAAAFHPVAAEQAGRDAAGPRRGAGEEDPLGPREDTFTLSDQGRALAGLQQPGAVRNQQTEVDQRNPDRGTEDEKGQAGSQGSEGPAPGGDATRPRATADPDDEDRRLTDELRRIDRQVRAHEQAHAAAGGSHVRYEYETGPDGRRYAVAGTTDIDVCAPTNDADGKLAQARKLRAAALAPTDPSGQDMAVAAKASRLEREARMEKADALRQGFQQFA